MTHVLYACKGTGSAIVEAMLDLAGLPYRLEECNYAMLGPDCAQLRALNPLGQVPTMALPSGQVMTESAAVTLYIHDQCPEVGLVPAPDDPCRSAFQRWLIFLVSAVYPTFTFGDEPARWVAGEAADALRRSTDQERQRLWLFLDNQVEDGRWFFGETFTALDIYLAVMTRWRPRRAWFRDHCPNLTRVALQADAHPVLSRALQRNFT